MGGKSETNTSQSFTPKTKKSARTIHDLTVNLAVKEQGPLPFAGFFTRADRSVVGNPVDGFGFALQQLQGPLPLGGFPAAAPLEDEQNQALK